MIRELERAASAARVDADLSARQIAPASVPRQVAFPVPPPAPRSEPLHPREAGVAPRPPRSPAEARIHPPVNISGRDGAPRTRPERFSRRGHVQWMALSALFTLGTGLQIWHEVDAGNDMGANVPSDLASVLRVLGGAIVAASLGSWLALIATRRWRLAGPAALASLSGLVMAAGLLATRLDHAAYAGGTAAVLGGIALYRALTAQIADPDGLAPGTVRQLRALRWLVPVLVVALLMVPRAWVLDPLGTNANAAPAADGSSLPEKIQAGYLWGPGVSDEARVAVQEAVHTAEQYFPRRLGVTIRRPVTLDVHAGRLPLGSGSGYQLAHRVVIATTYHDGTPASLLWIKQAVVHELAHVLQGELSQDRYEVDGPVWLVEGSAELISEQALAWKGDLSLADALDCDLLSLRPGATPPLQALYDRASILASQGDRYALATLGVDQATDLRTVVAVRVYFQKLAHAGWQQAFKAAFGTDQAAFYRDFADYRAGLGRPSRRSCNFYYDDQ